MSNPTLKILPALMIAIAAALVTQPMRAGINPIDTLVITENSSTSLTATLNNNPVEVDPFGADQWFIVLPGVSGVGINGMDPTQSWVEPDFPAFINQVIFQTLFAGQLFVRSDVDAFGGIEDGTPDTSTFTLNGSPLSVTFFDKGDVATVPDTGTTASLLGLSLTGLAFLRRRLC